MVDAGCRPLPILTPLFRPARTAPQLSFDVTLGGQAAKPQQVMILLRSAAGQLSAQLVGRSKKAGSYALTASLAAIEKQVGKAVSSAEGCYHVALFEGIGVGIVCCPEDSGSISLRHALMVANVYSIPD